jgi:hypothetical protein
VFSVKLSRHEGNVIFMFAPLFTPSLFRETVPFTHVCLDFYCEI